LNSVKQQPDHSNLLCLVSLVHGHNTYSFFIIHLPPMSSTTLPSVPPQDAWTLTSHKLLPRWISLSHQVHSFPIPHFNSTIFLSSLGFLFIYLHNPNSLIISAIKKLWFLISISKLGICFYQLAFFNFFLFILVFYAVNDSYFNIKSQPSWCCKIGHWNVSYVERTIG